MRLIDYLDKGASLDPGRPFLTVGTSDLSYCDAQRLTYRVARALQRSSVAPGEKVAVLSGNDATAFACVFGISRAGAVWCPINPRNEASENQYSLDAFDCVALIYQSGFAPLVDRIRPHLPKMKLFVCLDEARPETPSLAQWLDGADDTPIEIAPIDDVAMIAGTGGTTGKPKGVMLSGRNLEVMSAMTLAGYPFPPRPVYLALAPLTHAAGVLCLPIMSLGGRVVIMPKPDLADFLASIQRFKVTHAYLPPTLIYMLLKHADLPRTDLSSLRCFWYGAAPMSPARLAEALERFGPVMAQFFGQTEAPMMVTTMSPSDHFEADGSIATSRLASAGRPSAFTQVAIMGEDGALLPAGTHGEIVVRGPLVMPGYYKDPEATRAASRNGWHRTGDIGYLDADDFLFIVDRAKDMIITGGFNVYSAEVEQALLEHPDIQDAAVIGLPDEKWGERVTAVVQWHEGRDVAPDDVIAFVKSRIGSVKAPKTLIAWPSLPRSKVGKVLKKDIRSQLLAEAEKAG